MHTGISRYQQASRIGRAEKNTGIREDLILQYAPLVKYIVERMAMRLPPHISKEELISTGIVGLIDALNHFDEGKGIKFQTYAAYRVRGTIIDELRRLDWIPRSVRKGIQRIEEAILTIQFRTGREPDDIEIAEEMGMDLDAYYKLLSKGQGGGLLSLDEVNRADDLPLLSKLTSSGPSPFDEVNRQELKGAIAKALSGLSEKEQMVVSLYYYDELTLKEIARILKLTESRISQIHSKAMIRLRTKLKSHHRSKD